MTDGETIVPVPGRRVLLSLFLARFAIQPGNVLVILLFLLIGLTFGLPVGMMGVQLYFRSVSVYFNSEAVLVSSIIVVVVGALSIRFTYKSLLLLGLGLVSISAAGSVVVSFLAPNVGNYHNLGILWDVGRAMVIPMTYSLVALHFPLERRARAIGWVNAAFPLASLISAPRISRRVLHFLVQVGGGCWPFLWLLPMVLLSLVLAVTKVPAFPQSSHFKRRPGMYSEGFKRVFTNRSATSCLVGLILTIAGFQAVQIYGTSFFRQHFLVSTEITFIIFISSTLTFFVGTLGGGQVVTRWGRKPVTVVTTVVAGIFIIFFTNMPSLWLAVLSYLLGNFVGGMGFTAITSLTLEQVPRFRGTMMSLFVATLMVGTVLGKSGGDRVLFMARVLRVADYGMLGLVLGALCLVAALIYYLLAIDPTSEYQV